MLLIVAVVALVVFYSGYRWGHRIGVADAKIAHLQDEVGKLRAVAEVTEAVAAAVHEAASKEEHDDVH